MRVLAIDPGSTESAWLLYDAKTHVIENFSIEANARCLNAIESFAPRVNVVACEMIACYGMAVGREVFDTCVWIGQFWHQANCAGCPFRLVYRLDVKMHLCHNGRAKDPNIRAALIDRFGKDATSGIKTHLWSALAVAVTYADKECAK